MPALTEPSNTSIMSQPLQYARHEQGQSFNVPAHSSRTARTSRSPQSFNMDRLGVPGKMNTQIYDPYAAMSPTHPSTRETYQPFQASSDFQIRQMMGQDSNPQHQPENPIARFISEESPWDALGGRQHGNLPLSLGHIPDYGAYRNTTAPSEADTIGPITLISDSGYGSMPRQSVGIPSVYGDVDHNADTQSLIQGVSEFQFHPGLSPESAPSRGEEPKREAWKHHATANSDGNDLYCDVCKTSLKTKSELKKHEQRHSKPHRCDMENCPRNGDGFSTLNDLARHKQTVHKVGGTKYRCTIGQCASKKKDWPRADNFKQHLFRVHQRSPDSLESFIHRNPETEKLSYGDPSEAMLQPPIKAHPGSLSSWGQPVAINSAMSTIEEAETGQLDHTLPLSERSPSIGAPSLGGIDQNQYSGQMAFDGMGLCDGMDRSIPQFDGVGQHLRDSPTSEPMLDSTQSCINPDILSGLNHLRTSFPRLQPGTRDIHSQVLELESDGQVTYNQDDRGAEIFSGRSACLTSSDQVTEGPTQEPTAADEEDIHDSDAEDSGILDDMEQSPSPRAASEQPAEAKAEIASYKTETTTAASTPESMELDETDASALIQSLMKKQMLDDILQKLGYRMVKETDIKSQSGESSNSEPSASTDEPKRAKHGCDVCSKSFSRACELRKHRKRHDKPYACTYAGCDKRFGSKNDWKRHENSQHFLLECWKCNERAKDSPHELCGKVCHRRETFSSHLEKDHGLDSKAIDGKWNACRVGRNFETRFWCGFCKLVVELDESGGHAWRERFNHIDDHFNGRNGKLKVSISEWKSVESEPLESLDFMRTVKPQLPKEPRDRLSFSDRRPNSESSRKRHRSRSRGDDALLHYRRKRVKGVDGEVFWSCCSCNNVWSPATTGNTCMNCSHTHCEYCTMEAHNITENVSATLSG